MSSWLLLAFPRDHPNVRESAFIFANSVQLMHNPFHSPNVGLASVIVVASTLGDAVIHDPVVDVEVCICLSAFVRGAVECLEIVPKCVIVLPLSRMSCQS